MNIFEKIKEFVKRITIRTPQIEASKNIPDGFIAPKGIRDDDDYNIESFAQRLSVSEKDLVENPVKFKDLEEEVSQKLSERIKKIGGKLGWTHNSKPTISGELNDNHFVSIKRNNVRDDLYGQTICTENGYYEIKTSKDNPKRGNYEEHITFEDGTYASFSTDFGSDSNRVYSTTEKNGISLKEAAYSPRIHGEDFEFENFAQPSDELLEEYSKTTGLPIIMDSHKMYGDNGLKKKTNLDIKDFVMTMREQNAKFPYIVSIEASKQLDGENKPKKKTIKYAYNSLEDYKSGKKPNMIYMDGIDGRTGFSGMFRLKGDSYIDNSTFRKENGEFTFDTISYDQIMELAGKMPTQLSNRVNSAILGEFRMSPEIQQIYEKAISIEKEKENPNQLVD